MQPGANHAFAWRDWRCPGLLRLLRPRAPAYHLPMRRSLLGDKGAPPELKPLPSVFPLGAGALWKRRARTSMGEGCEKPAERQNIWSQARRDAEPDSR